MLHGVRELERFVKLIIVWPAPNVMIFVKFRKSVAIRAILISSIHITLSSHCQWTFTYFINYVAGSIDLIRCTRYVIICLVIWMAMLYAFEMAALNPWHRSVNLIFLSRFAYAIMIFKIEKRSNEKTQIFSKFLTLFNGWRKQVFGVNLWHRVKSTGFLSRETLFMSVDILLK